MNKKTLTSRHVEAYGFIKKEKVPFLFYLFLSTQKSLESTDGFSSEQMSKTKNHEALLLLRQYILIFTTRFTDIESINPKQTQKKTNSL